MGINIGKACEKSVSFIGKACNFCNENIGKACLPVYYSMFIVGNKSTKNMILSIPKMPE